jgi:hypothetical protein
MVWNKQRGKSLKLKGWVLFGLVSCFLVLSSAERSSAQTFAEWWSQKKTQISYLNQQIVALMVYGRSVKEGYQISQSGLGSISGWAKGELEQHTFRYSSLRQVNPNIRDDKRAVGVVNDLNRIVGQLSALDRLSGLSADDWKYIRSVRVKVLAGCDANASELELVMTSGEAEMTDDERLDRLAHIDERVKDLWSFTSGFCSRVKVLILQREQAERDLITVRRVYGIN